MRIVYFITGLGIGGAEAITVNIANRMQAAGQEVSIVYLAGDNRQKDVLCPDIRVICLNMQKTPAGFVQALSKARKVLRDIRPDVVHAQMIHANIFARILRLFYPIPFLISTEHSKNIGGRGRMWLYRITDRLSDVNTNVSEEATGYFIARQAFSLAKTTTVYNGIDLNRFGSDPSLRESIRQLYGIGQDEFLFLNVGRLVPAKDHKNLLDAFEKVEKKFASSKLLIVGEGELRKELEDCAGKKGLAGKVIFAGMRQNTEAYYNAADCFVLSSAWEGFGLVLAEAMACGVPVVSTDAGGCAEVVNDPRYVVPVRDAEALSRIMEEICRMPAGNRASLGEANRHSAGRFSLETICRQWTDIYTKQKIV